MNSLVLAQIAAPTLGGCIATTEASPEILYSSTLPRFVTIGDLVIDLLRQEVSRNNKKLLLSGMQYMAFLYLACHAKRLTPLSKEELDVWSYGRAQPNSTSACTVLYRVRRELKFSGSNVSLPSGERDRRSKLRYKLMIGA